nr:hypothetical protein [Tanacetum cinerariifolium]
MQIVGGNKGISLEICWVECRNQGVQNVVQNLGVQNVRNQNGVIVVSGIANQNRNGNVVAARAKGNAIENNGNQVWCYNYRGLGHLARNCTVRPKRRDAAYLQTQLMIAQNVEQGGGTVEQHPVNVEETHVLYDSLYNNLATEVEKVNSFN